MYQKDFDGWNIVKKQISSDREPLYFREGDIWWVHVGINVGYEVDGKNEGFSRPVLVVRKFNKYSFLGLPLTTNAAPSRWRLSVGTVDGKDAYAILSQIKNFDSRRLIEKKGHLSPDTLTAIRKEASLQNFG